MPERNPLEVLGILNHMKRISPILKFIGIFINYLLKSRGVHVFIYNSLASVGGEPQNQIINEPPLWFKQRQKIPQEPKRYSSVKTIPRTGISQTQYNQIYPAQFSDFHRSGISTPPPGLNYYDNSLTSSYNMYQQYVLNEFNGVTQGNPYEMQGYYPMYMNYPAYQQPTGYYTPPVQPVASSPSKKKCHPSQFRPHQSSFSVKEQNCGNHKAENEELIVSKIEAFEKENNLEILRGKITELAITQTGSRFLQRQLTKSSPSFISFVLEEVSFEIYYRLKKPFQS